MRSGHANGLRRGALREAVVSASYGTPAVLVLFHLPVIGLPAVLAALPVLLWVPGLAIAGPDVAYFPGYVVLKSGYAWTCVGVYYFCGIVCARLLHRMYAHMRPMDRVHAR